MLSCIYGNVIIFFVRIFAFHFASQLSLGMLHRVRQESADRGQQRAESESACDSFF